MLQINAQQFDKLWEQVETQEALGKTKSASEIVNTIYKKAKRKNNNNQLIKALIYKSKFALTLQEDAELLVAQQLEAEIKNSIVSNAAILSSILADFKWQYFQQHRWQIYNRTKTDEIINDDFRTWSLDRLFTSIHNDYKNSIAHKATLQKIVIDDISVLLKEEKTTVHLRPTLYDLLAHRALSFFEIDESRITKPKDRFYIDKKGFFADSKTFSTIKLQATDTILSKFEVLKTYQALEQFHLQNNNADALTEVYLNRLKFVRNNTTLPNANDLYIDSLKKSYESIQKGFPYAAIKATYATAIYHRATSETHPKDRVKALAVCNEIIKSYSGSEGFAKASNLKTIILHSEINIQTEQYIPSYTPAKMLVSYKNTKQLYFKAYLVEQTHDFSEYNYMERDSVVKAFFKTRQPIKEWYNTLPQQKDYFTHTTELVIPELINAKYIILATEAKDFNATKPFSWTSLNVTDLVCVESKYQGKQILQVLNRTTGTPIKGAKVAIASTVKYTDDLGEISYNKRNRHNIVISYKGDELHLNNRYAANYYRKPKDLNKKLRGQAFLFLDRSIYRPGQKVHFKGIVLERINYKSNVAVDKPFVVTVQDANYQTIKTFHLKTNAYGSFSESFDLPKDVLTGNFNIQINQDGNTYRRFQSAYTNFSVEEYKRPKFEVLFEPIKETYLVNQNICVKGNANALLGTAITDAKVAYRVVRRTQYSHWRYWSSRHHGQDEQEIAIGEVATNENGAFEINFNAIPDETKDKAGLPIFNYEVTADVTDINGETRSATTTVKVGYHSMNIAITSPTNWNTDNDNSITLNTENLNGEFVPASLNVKVYKLQVPNRVLRKRSWKAPDLPSLSKEEFYKLFPHEAFKNEDDAANWEKGKLVFEKNIHTKDTKNIPIQTKNSKWESGKYVVVVNGKDSFDLDIAQEQQLSLFNHKDQRLADHQLFKAEILNKASALKDGFIKLKLLTAADDLNVLVESYYQNKIHYKENTVVNGSQLMNIPLAFLKKDGALVPDANIRLQFSLVRFNEHKVNADYINLPTEENYLTITTESFRDKLAPGQKEKWSFTIKDNNKKGVESEILASMYDASLDQFKPHNWDNTISINDYYYNGVARKHSTSFGIKNFINLNTKNSPQHYQNYKQFSKLQHFGFGLNYRVKNEYQLYLRSKNINRGKTKTISGVITDESGLPLPGATVLIKGTTIGTTTDFDGRYSIEVLEGDQLEISYVGYSSNSITVGKETTLNSQMDGESSLEEVVVVASGIKRKDRNRERVIEGDQRANFKQSNGDYSGISGWSDDDAAKDSISYAFNTNKATPSQDFSGIVARKNLNETAFFYPHLKTDSKGNLHFEFESPEALTRWKLQLFGHTKTGTSGKLIKEVVTQKDLMVIPNPPRFLRENDTIVFQSKISNLSDQQLNGFAKLELYDAVTRKAIDIALNNKNAIQNFSVDQKGNTSVSWQLIIPEGVAAVEYKVLAKANNFTDGESSVLPVLTNSMLVTESIPLTVRSNSKKEFSFNKLKNNTSTTLRNHQLTLEYTTNPAWYAIQSLPYLMEFPHECAEQTFARYYANTLGSHIINSNPNIKTVFESWKTNGKLTSKLEQNEELKEILIAETPWLRDAQSETEKKKQLALLFDLEKLSSEQKRVYKKLKQLQLSSGGFPWFKGGYENEYITRHIVAGFGHLRQLNVIENNQDWNAIINRAVTYLDRQFVKHHKEALKHQEAKDIRVTHYHLHYLYTRSFFKNTNPFSKEAKEITNLYLNKTQLNWLERSLLDKTLLALISHRFMNNELPKQILTHLKETAIIDEEKGMYWKSNSYGWYWYQAPIETQALIIEAFNDIDQDVKTIEELQIWLLNNKRKNDWNTTKATTDAVYALLLQGNDWLSVEGTAEIKIGNEKIKTKKLDQTQVEAGSGYFKTSWSADEITNKMTDISVKNTSKVTQFGGYYWQYFEQLDKITNEEHKNDIQLHKELFLKKNTEKGPELIQIKDKTKLEVGDLVTVRIELQVKDNFEFVHLKDMRASAFEPVDVLSQYKWQDGLGYYQSTKDVATHFFFDYLRKGTYVLEYNVRVNNSGNFSNGISSIQSMYAPEFTSHSKGVRVTVQPKN